MRVLLALAAVAAVALPGAPARAQPDAGVIAYTRDPDGPTGPAEPTIYVARGDGTGERVYTTGHAPSLAPGDAVVAYSVRANGAAQLVVGRLDDPASVRQVTSFPDGERDHGAFRYGAYGSTWSPGRQWLAVRLTEGSTTTVALVRPDGSAFRRLPFGHVYGSRLAWRDDAALAVGTDEGLRLATTGGHVTTVLGSAPTDTPAGWLDAGRVVVNTPRGADVLDVTTGKRSPLAGGVQAWGVTPLGDVVYTTGAEVGAVGRDGARRPLAALPKGAQAIDVVTDREPLLVEIAEADGTRRIAVVEPAGGAGGAAAFQAGELRAIATGGDLTASDAAAYDDVTPPPAAPPGTTGAPATTPPATTAPPGGPTPGPVALPAPGDPPPGRSAFTDAVPAADEVDTGARAVLVSALVTVLLMVLVTFPAELFNNTLEEHYDEVRGWFRRKPRDSGPPRSRARRVATFTGYAAAAALLYGLLDPSFGPDATSARLYAGLLLGLVVVTVVFSAAPLAYARRRYGERGLLRVLPGTLVVGVVCVLVSRAARFEPGYLYGIVGGFAFARRFSADEEGRNALVAAGAAFGASLLAWLVWQPVDSAVAAGDPGLAVGLADSTLATIAVGGLEGLVIGLVPLRSLQGYALARWRRPAWAAAYGVVLFTFVHLLLRPGSGAALVPFWTWLGLFAGFGAVSIAFWGYFRVRVSSG